MIPYFLASAIPLCVAAHYFCRSCFAKSSERLIFWPVALFAEVVVLAEAGSIFGLLAEPFFWMGGSLAWLLLALLAWHRHPSLPPMEGARTPLLFPWKRPWWGAWAWKWPCLFAMAAYAGILLTALLLPPNTWDGMSYHVARVGYYLQQGSLEHFSTPNSRQTDFPVNAELFILWTVALAKSDQFAALLQAIAAFGSATAVYGLSVRMRLPHVLAWLGALICLGLPQVALQASSTQNDLTVAWLICAALYAALASVQSGRGLYAAAAGVCAGLALGTKLTALLYLPGAVVFLIAAARSGSRGRAFAPFTTLALWTLAGTLAFAGPHVWRNYRANGFFVPKVDIARVTEPSALTFGANAARAGLELLDANGLPYPANRAIGIAKRKLAEAAGVNTEWLNPPAATYPGTRFEFANNVLSEDVAWYGPLGVLLVIGAAIAACSGIRKRRWPWAAYASAAALAVLAMWLTLRWQPWSGRFYCASMLLLIPAALKGIALLLRRRRRRFRRGAWGALAAFSAFSCMVVLLQNELKPLMPIGKQPSVFSLTKDQQRCRHRPTHVELSAFINQLGPSRIGFCADEDQWDRLAFGDDFRHFVVRYDADINIAAAFEKEHCDVIVCQRDYVGLSAGMQWRAVKLNAYWVALLPLAER